MRKFKSEQLFDEKLGNEVNTSLETVHLNVGVNA